MHAYLVTNNDIEILRYQVIKLIEQLGTKRLDFKLQKIADVREMAKFTKLKLTEKTAIVTDNFDEVGEEGQNAFLKALEEPQENLIYILTAKNINTILPTIISRCEVIEVYSMQYKVYGEKQEQIQNFLDAGAGERMGIVSKINKREEAVEFVNNILIVCHNEMANGQWRMAEEALKTLKALKANGNVQLQLTNFVVNLNQS